jgi:hypothetical protein
VLAAPPSSNAPKAFMSSKNAEYESSMLGGFIDVVAEDLENGAGATGAAVTVVVDVGIDVNVDVLGFNFGAFSLLTRTDAGTIEVSSGVC